ncbi:MAG: 30S ribosomal protein S12 methylthiotransferase RimO [Myxococcota bacterium]|nr:30S ribosomal protein S12 methylthiotransferase RimO [Myxococcota bacterium]
MTNPKVHFVSLGCPKNRVDSEIMLGHLQDASFSFTHEAEQADVIVVNTCGFIEDAKQESVNTILEMARQKDEGQCKKLIVTGCLVERYSEELSQEIPEIDNLLGNGAYTSVTQVAKDAAEELGRVTVGNLEFIHSAETPRVNTFMPHSAYVKVAEGCDQKCSFCIIPKLRGLQRSRTIDDIEREVRSLGNRGVVEVNLIAQDLTGYGHDLDPRVNLAQLVRRLGRLDEIEWVRLHYAYPRPFGRELLAAIAEEPKVLPYIDMPLQHISDPVLKRMKRGRPRRFIEKLLREIREAVPEVTVRTSFIVGFPGETDEDFAELCDYVQNEDFERVGVFKFSLEEGTSSYDLDGRVPQEVIDERHHHLMELLRDLSTEKMATYQGKKIEVLVDGVSEETELLLAGRHKGQAPEIDGVVYINDGEAKAGDLVEVEITDSFDYDLVGHITKVLRPAPSRPDHARFDIPSASAHRSETLSAVSGRPSLPILPG